MKHMTVTISIVLAMVIAGVAFQVTQAQQPQRQPGERPSGFRVMRAVENTWAAIAFELKIDKATLEKARPHFQKAWDERKKLMKDSAGDFQAISNGMIKIKADLDEKLKTVLTAEQLKKLAEWEKTQQQLRMRAPRRRQPQEQRVGLIQNDEGSFKGYTLFAPFGSTITYLIDNDGRIVNKWESDYWPGQSAYLLENGHLLRTASLGPRGNSTFHGGGAGGRVREFTWDGTLVWDFEYSSDEHLLHHDIERLPNGNVLMIAWERKTGEEAIAAGRDPELQGDGDLWSDHIIEVKPTGKTTGEIVWEWHVWDHLIQDVDPSKANYGVVADHPELININPVDWVRRLSPEERKKLESLGYLGPLNRPKARHGNPDWNHTNAIAYNAELDQIVLTVLGFNEIWIIDHSTTTKEAAGHTGGRSGKGGDLLYRWGNPKAYRAGTTADQQLFAHHDASWIPYSSKGTGNLLVFNNGRGRPDGDYSSVDEIVLPVDEQGRYAHEAGTAFGPDKTVWIYTASQKTDFYSSHISGAQRLPNGNTLITSGENGTIFEITQKKKIVWKYVNPVEAEAPPGPGGFGPGMHGPRMGGEYPGAPPRLDLDGDGLVTYKEASVLPFMNQELFKHLDANRDGVLDQEELPKGPPPGMPGPGRGGPGNMLFKAYRYAPDFPGLAGKDLTPGEPIEANPRAPMQRENQ